MSDAQQTEYVMQSELVYVLVASLRNKATRKDVRLIETHISWVILSGRYAWKIKKSLDLGFLNFVGLETRRYYCDEEVRLNCRLAPKIYLKVVPIGGSCATPLFDIYPALEYAVKMRRFAISKQLDYLVSRHKLLPLHIDHLAATVAQFHGNLPAVGTGSPYGSADSVNNATEQNFIQIQSLMVEHGDFEALDRLHRASAKEYLRCRNLFEQRLQQGAVRECHGDLHLGNIVLIDNLPIPFDCIEFNPSLRWIDVISEVAFLVMDLMHHQHNELAYRFLNVYLEQTGDYAGVKLLPYYVAYRAMVRAKVNAIRASQSELVPEETEAAWQTCRAYMNLAANSFKPKKAALIITHGLPGSGKSTFAQLAAERLQAIRLRSDVERKRLFGLSTLSNSRAISGIDLYSSDISARTYTRLYELASELLSAGVTVVVDAAFLKQPERVRFRQLANSLGKQFAIVSLQASNETLRARIKHRSLEGSDASEADVAVLEKIQQSDEALSAEELGYTVSFNNENTGVSDDVNGWHRLIILLG